MVFSPQLNDSNKSPSATQQSFPEKVAGKVYIDPRTKISDLLKDKETEWTSVVAKERPLQLLDLPIDVLKLIIKEVPHTNDLTALALTQSTLHSLVIPHIYSRFDIVWPDAHATTDPRTGVDALTYGLATLSLGNLFAASGRSSLYTCQRCGAENDAELNHESKFGPVSSQQRPVNHYSQYTRKFSLGNGPTDWVKEYLITKESGKMLGTLVALAVAKMINLETFIWDMPTGVLRDVWLALASLQTNNSSEGSNLKRVWVRWHDNSEAAGLSSTPNTAALSHSTPEMLSGTTTMTSIGWQVPIDYVPNSQLTSQPISYAKICVEYPTVSVLPPIKSLSVLDIDQLEYLDEMSVLISKSKDCLRELRVGISSKAVNRDFTIAWDGAGLHQVDHSADWPGASRIGQKRLGGVLGVLVGRIFDIRRNPDFRDTGRSPQTLGDVSIDESWKDYIISSRPVLSNHIINFYDSTVADVNELDPHALNHQSMTGTNPSQYNIEPLTTSMAARQFESTLNDQLPGPQAANRGKSQEKSQKSGGGYINSRKAFPSEERRLDGQLRLQTLELERIPLSIEVLQRAFDWSVLTNLTILDCPQHERLWQMLHKHFHPTTLYPHESTKNGANSVQYRLRIKKVHTDAASSALISFLKETLAPNSLETFFLQHRKRSLSTIVSIDTIYRGPLRRHSSSLKRLILDSSDKSLGETLNGPESALWMVWMPNRKVLNFITSSRMSSLRELSIAIDYRDWHHFLQRLPQIPQLRSLNIPFISGNAVPGSAFDSRELALQIVDVIFLRPEVELCYIGIRGKCFEVLESKLSDETHETFEAPFSETVSATDDVAIDDDEDDEDEDDNDTAISASVSIDPDETESDISENDSSDSDCPDERGTKIQLRLREILFYDDKVAIFKGRHGKL